MDKKIFASTIFHFLITSFQGFDPPLVEGIVWNGIWSQPSTSRKSRLYQWWKMVWKRW